MANTESRDIELDGPDQNNSGYQDTYANSYALVVGINTYKNPRLRPLGNAEQDARDMASVLQGEPYNFEVSLLLGEKAARKAITQELNRLRRISGLDDRIIFYFAGHGYIQEDNRDYDVGYLACADTDPDDVYDGLKFDEVMSLARFSKAKHIAFILDSCFSGAALGLTRSAMPDAAVKEYLYHEAYQVLTAGGMETVSDARSMTGELVKILKDGIPGQDLMTFNHVGQYVHDVIHAQSKGRQSPIYGMLEGSSKGQMVLVPPKPVDVLPDDLRDGLADPSPRVRRFAIAEAENNLTSPEYGEIIQDVLYRMQSDDEDLEVRRRAAEALRSFRLASQPAPEKSVGFKMDADSPAARTGLPNQAGTVQVETAEEKTSSEFVPEEREQTDEKIAQMRRAIEANSNDAYALTNLGILLSGQGRKEEAEESFRKAITANPNYAWAQNSLGVLLAAQGRKQEAKAAYQKAIELAPTYTLAYNNLGWLLQGQGEAQEAEATYRKAIELDPKNAWTLYSLGQLLKERGELKEAEAFYRQAIDGNPDYINAHIALGTVLAEKEQKKEAETEFRKAIELDPKNAWAHNNLGSLLQGLGRVEEAEAEYREAIEADPKYALAYNNLGWLMYILGRKNEAEAAYQKAIELVPNYAMAYNNLGWLQYGMGQTTEAEAAFRKAIELDPKNAWAHNNLGVLLNELGAQKGAEAAFREAIKVAPNFSLARNNLEALLKEQGRAK